MTKRRFGGFGTKRSTLRQSNNKGCRLEDPFKETGPRRNHFSFDTRLPEVLFKFTHPHPKQVQGNYLVDPMLFDFQVLLHQKKGGTANRGSSMDWRIVSDGGLITIFSAPVTSSTKWISWTRKTKDLVTQKGFVNIVEKLIAKFHPELHALAFCPNAGCQRPHNKVPAQVQ